MDKVIGFIVLIVAGWILYMSVFGESESTPNNTEKQMIVQETNEINDELSNR